MCIYDQNSRQSCNPNDSYHTTILCVFTIRIQDNGEAPNDSYHTTILCVFTIRIQDNHAALMTLIILQFYVYLRSESKTMVKPLMTHGFLIPKCKSVSLSSG